MGTQGELPRTCAAVCGQIPFREWRWAHHFSANARILKSLGIETRIDLPGVGENLIEQPSHFLLFSGDLQDSSASAYHSYVTAADLFGADLTAVEAATRASIPKWAKAAADASGARSVDACALEKVLKIQHDLLFKHNVTAAEILLAIAPDNILASNYWALFPFSRGSVHLESADNINKPLVDPRIFLADFDLATVVAAGRLAEKFWLSEPMKRKGSVTGPIVSGGWELPDNATDAQWRAYLRDTGKQLSLTPSIDRLALIKHHRDSCCELAPYRYGIDDVSCIRGSGRPGAQGLRHCKCKDCRCLCGPNAS